MKINQENKIKRTFGAVKKLSFDYGQQDLETFDKNIVWKWGKPDINQIKKYFFTFSVAISVLRDFHQLGIKNTFLYSESGFSAFADDYSQIYSMNGENHIYY